MPGTVRHFWNSYPVGEVDCAFTLVQTAPGWRLSHVIDPNATEMVHFVQRRTGRGLENEHTVIEVIEHIAAPRQLRLPDITEQREPQ